MKTDYTNKLVKRVSTGDVYAIKCILPYAYPGDLDYKCFRVIDGKEVGQCIVFGVRQMASFIRKGTFVVLDTADSDRDNDMKRHQQPEGISYMQCVIEREQYLRTRAHSDKSYAELQETFEYQPYRLRVSVAKNSKREVLVAELERIDAVEKKVSDDQLTNETKEVITETSTQEDKDMNANQLKQTKAYEMKEKSYKQLQAYAKDLREQGFYKGKLNVTRECLIEGIALAVDAMNESLKERNEQAVRGNQSPRHRAGSVANLMAGSKARAERENAGKQDVKTYKNGRAKAPQYKAANKAFYANTNALSYGAPERKASDAFSYKQGRVHTATYYMTNGCCV